LTVLSFYCVVICVRTSDFRHLFFSLYELSLLFNRIPEHIDAFVTHFGTSLKVS